MNSESILTRQTLVFGECVRPIASKLRGRMESRPNPSERVTNIVGFLRHHLEQFRGDLDRLGDEVNQVGELLEIDDTPDNLVQRGAARMEIRLERLLDDYDEVRRARPAPVDSEGCRLIERVYGETLLRIQGWLDEIVECLNDPKGALEKHGLGEEGNHQPIPLALKLESPASMTHLNRWIKRQEQRLIADETARSDAPIEEASSGRSQGGIGFWGWVAAIVLGTWLGGLGGDSE
ncbi:MAG: hypothetical protein OXG96_12885 [Acidobacteria bacterium]|nr:hypothetical protein [Acidobacteriota bacterium]